MINVPVRRKIRPADVVTDRRAQRALDTKRVDGMVANFKPASFGVPSVSVRADGSITVIDGQHRFAALCEMGRGNVGIDCLTYEGLTLAEEAQLFKELNDSKNLTPSDLFRVAVTAGDPVAVAANRALELRGWTAERGKRNTMSAVSTFATYWERDPAAAKRAIEVLSGAWGPTQVSSSATAIKGMWMLAFRYASMGIDWDRMIRVLAAKGQAGQVLAQAKGNAVGRGISVVDGFADLCVNTYNHRKPSNKIPVWDTSKS
jgi:hypothetical protein